jgi:hypothetical protein
MKYILMNEMQMDMRMLIWMSMRMNMMSACKIRLMTPYNHPEISSFSAADFAAAGKESCMGRHAC